MVVNSNADAQQLAGHIGYLTKMCFECEDGSVRKVNVICILATCEFESLRCDIIALISMIYSASALLLSVNYQANI